MLKKIRGYSDKFFLFLDRTGILEMIDFVKDLIYARSVNHKTFLITLLLWGSALFTTLFTAFKIILMNTDDYIKAFGLIDFKDV